MPEYRAGGAATRERFSTSAYLDGQRPKRTREEQGFIEVVANLWNEKKMQVASAVASRWGRAPNVEEIPEDKLLDMFEFRALGPEQEADLWLEGQSPEEITVAVFPFRERAVKSGGRTTYQEWAEHAEALDRKSRARLAKRAADSNLPMIPESAAAPRRAPDPDEMDARLAEMDPLFQAAAALGVDLASAVPGARPLPTQFHGRDRRTDPRPGIGGPYPDSAGGGAPPPAPMPGAVPTPALAAGGTREAPRPY